jgi:hypothetical protein
MFFSPATQFLKACFLLAACMTVTVNAQAEPKDSTRSQLTYPNNIKLNISAPILYSPAFVVSYERSVKPYQTFSVIGGYVTFPQLIRSLPDSINLEETKSQSGFRVGGDYRFYFKKENKHEAPHGLYWGPFIDYYYFNNKRTITVVDTTFASGALDFDGKLMLAQVGVGLGYQFSVLKDRMSIDLALLGPAVAYYKGDLSLKGDFNAEFEDEYLQDLFEYLIESFPLLGDLSAGLDKEVSGSGVADLFYLGFRYSIWIGFRF